jgi:ubiquinone/menaquinone biosynthesis C-methylase UbiE
MEFPNYIKAYESLCDALIAQHGREQAMALIVGGMYREMGILESSALLTHGLRPEHNVVDVGCGSGRLAVALRPFLTGKFTGTDVLQKALDYAAEKCARPDWEFVRTIEPEIPPPAQSADYICFFSVFTHLLDEDIYRFLAESKRVARPGGTIVFSYLDFEVPSHWTIFELTVADRNPNRVLNKFISKGAIHKWCAQLGLTVEKLHDGHARWIKLTEPFRYVDGREASGTVEFGQSVAIVRA